MRITNKEFATPCQNGGPMPLTKKQVKAIDLNDFGPVMSYTRYRSGQIVPQTVAGYSRPRFKRSFDQATRSYVIKMARA